MAHRRFFKWLLIGASLATSCGGSQPPSSVKSWLDEEDAQSAFEAASEAVPYLPFGYIEDGCYARAFYMAMEAAAVALPVSVQYIYMPSGYISPDGVVRWGYHAATMIWIEGESEPSIADPALFNKPVHRDEWLTRLQPTESPELQYAAGSNLAFFSDAPQPGPTAPTQLMTSVGAMSDFAASDVSYACSLMANYINIEPGLTPAAKTAKTTRLMARTKALVARLTSQGLISGDLSSSPDSCY